MERKTLSIVIPAFNEALRLPPTLEDLRRYQGQSPLDIKEVIVVDDGSKDETLKTVLALMQGWPELRVQSLTVNSGKGAALRAGVLGANSEWVLLADADQSTPWDQLEVLWQAIQQNQLDGAIGSRALRESQIEVRQNLFRQTLGRSFNRILRGLTGLPFRDTQCGFKMFRRSQDLQQIFQELSTLRFAYDVEVLLRLLRKKARVQEVPVRWAHKDESRVHLVFDSSEMLWSVVKLRWNMVLRVK